LERQPVVFEERVLERLLLASPMQLAL
jgi:hypothetical protein